MMLGAVPSEARAPQTQSLGSLYSQAQNKRGSSG